MAWRYAYAGTGLLQACLYLDIRQGIAKRGCAPARDYHRVAAPADQHLPHKHHIVMSKDNLYQELWHMEALVILSVYCPVSL